VGRRQPVGRTQRIQVEGVDDRGVWVGAEVDHHLPALALERVDVVEGEEGIGLEGAGGVAAVERDEPEACAALGLPAVVLDERPRAHREATRIDDDGKLGEDRVALGEAEGVHVGRVAGGDLADDAAPRVVRTAR